MASKMTKVRKLKPIEIFHEVAQSRYKCMITCYWLILESGEVVSEEKIEEALKILSRNIDILNLSIQEENGEFWFYKMADEIIPLEVLRNVSPDDVFHSEMQTSIDSAKGPLWRANYIINEKGEKGNDFTSNIIFTFHHAISDGFTAFTICNSFLKVLNDVISGRVQKSYYFGELSDGHESDMLMAERTKYLKENPEYLAEIKGFMNNLEKQKVMFTDLFPVPDNVKHMTKYIHREIDVETNKKILKIFKSKGITFHSGFSAVANWAIMELFTENGLIDRQIEMTAFHMINLRRYFKKSSTVQLGPYVASVGLLSNTDENVGANFWEYARKLNESLKNGIATMQGIDASVIMFMLDPQGPDTDITKIFENFPSNTTYYVTTNMGELSSMLQGRGDHVNIKWLARCTSTDALNTVMTHIFQTYEQKFLYGLGYSTHLLREDVANMYVDKIISKLKIISNLPL